MEQEKNDHSIFSLQRLELILIGLTIVGFVFIEFYNQKLMLPLALVGLAIVFFLKSFKPIEIEPGTNEGSTRGMNELLSYFIVPKVLWINIAILSVGLSFYYFGLHARGYTQMMTIGILGVFIASLVLLFTVFKNSQVLDLHRHIYYRALPLMLVDGYILYEHFS